MLITALQPITDVFDWLHSLWERATTQRRVALCILWVYLVALLGVELKRQGVLPPWLAVLTPYSHFYAIHLAFTLILGLEVVGLILVIPSSLSQSMRKAALKNSRLLLRNKCQAETPSTKKPPSAQEARTVWANMPQTEEAIKVARQAGVQITTSGRWKKNSTRRFRARLCSSMPGLRGLVSP